MRLRLALGRFLIKAGSFIQSLPVAVMKPDDLVELGRQTYSSLETVELWSNDKFLSRGLTPLESGLLEKLPTRKGSLLLLGLGGGREAIRLAEMGFEVTGVDFVPAMAAKAQKNAARRGLSISTTVQEISKFAVASNSQAVVWMSTAMYSSIPTASKRKQLLERIRLCLKPGGYLVLQFYGVKPLRSRPLANFLRKVFAWATLGNFSYEEGDVLLGGSEFMHVFHNEERLRAELTSVDFDLVYINLGGAGGMGGAVLRKNKD